MHQLRKLSSRLLPQRAPRRMETGLFSRSAIPVKVCMTSLDSGSLTPRACIVQKKCQRGVRKRVQMNRSVNYLREIRAPGRTNRAGLTTQPAKPVPRTRVASFTQLGILHILMEQRDGVILLCQSDHKRLAIRMVPCEFGQVDLPMTRPSLEQLFRIKRYLE